MTDLRDALSGWRDPFARLPPLAPTRTERAAKLIFQRFSDIGPKVPSQVDLEETYWTLGLVANEELDWMDIGRRDIRRTPWVFFESWNGEEPLLNHPDFVGSYLRHLGQAADGSAVMNLCQAFFRYYPRTSPLFGALRESIGKLLKQCRRPRCERLATCVQKYGLLNLDAPERVWRMIEDSELPITKCLEEAALVGPLARLGLVEVVFEKACASARTALRRRGAWSAQHLNRFFDLATEEGAVSSLRFPGSAHRVGLIENLVLPLASPNSGTDLRDSVKAFILRCCGDPRLDRSQWQGVSSDAISIFYGWLVKDTLEDFFRLLEYAARSDTTASRHWKYRKAFWTAYLRAGVIQDAWVVLSPVLDREAKRLLRGNESAYGRLHRGSGVLPNHAVLVLRIGELVITEWSHTGKYRTWREGNRSADQIPAFYQSEYRRQDLTFQPDSEGVHFGAERGSWQEKLSTYIRRRTGIRMRRSEWQP